MNIIQFLPYYPPHKGGLETHAQQFSEAWVESGYGDVLNVVYDIDLEDTKEKKRIKIIKLPAFDIVPNFPFPKFWKKEYKQKMKEIQGFIQNAASGGFSDFSKATCLNPNLGLVESCDGKIRKSKGVNKTSSKTIIITRTRFFLSTFIGGLFARKHGLNWVHIEHGSDFVKLSGLFSTFIAYLYDKTIGKWVFKKADLLVGVSKACKKFIQNEFTKRKVDVIYRGLKGVRKGNSIQLRNKFKGKIIVGFVGRLFKWKNVSSLINAYYKLDDNLKNKIQIIIIGDGEDLDRLKRLDKNDKIHFTGAKTFDETINMQNEFDIHVHSSSKGGGLASTLLQAMRLGPLIVATPYEGANEVINSNNGILLKNDSINEIKKGLELGVKSLDKKEKWAKINKEIINNKFNWKKSIKEYYNLFGSL